MKYFADTKQGPNRDRPTGFDLLPVPGREAEGDHVLLAVAFVLALLADSLTQGAEEFRLIYHTDGSKISRAKTPRAT